ncbi:MAG: FAD:protein FMN transferase [Armatimonadota bacterium]
MAEQVMLACRAMRCRFELVLYGDDPVRLRAAGEEAMEEVVRLDAQLSAFDPASEISDVNARAYREPVRIDPRLVRLLKRLAELSRLTHGAFDPTVAPLMRCWGLRDEHADRPPAPGELKSALDLVGMGHVEIDEDSSSVRFRRRGVNLDLGAVGKGYAVDRAVACLRELGIDRAFIHGGTSTSYGLGTPLTAQGWSVAVDRTRVGGGEPVIFCLKDSALSVSAPHGREVRVGDTVYGHVIDPRTGQPVKRILLAAVRTSSATEAEVFSTALSVLGAQWLPELARIAPEAEALVVWRDDDADGARTARLLGGKVTENWR